MEGLLAYTYSGYVGIVDEYPEIITKHTLEQNYPNPFNPSTNIRFELPNAANVRLNVYNIRGQLVAELLNEQRPAGKHSVVFDAADLPSGIYFYKIQSENFTRTHKMVLIR
ncbi:MAG: T9SS type A sorting domain-containing protein [Calditrichae bacterium]|nr:T9SS type A sorting domain-containing protein [Calditrichia bacterium]